MSDLQFTDERPIELGVPREKIDELKRTLLNELSPEEIEAARRASGLEAYN
jgi:hypothetical protein